MIPLRECLVRATLLAGLSSVSPAAMGAAPEACAALARRVAATPGDDALLLRSYDEAAAGAQALTPALETAAFVYDNALATIALLACGQRPAAERIGAALLAAAQRDSRLRNAYRAGRASPQGPLPNGWWSAEEKRWKEDAYQQGTATGNVAWAALALLSLDVGANHPRWRSGATLLADWMRTQASTATGLTGGVHGFAGSEVRLTWKSTEHNVDATALFEWLARLPDGERWTVEAGNARAFVGRQWDGSAGRFLIGSLPDDGGPNRAGSGLDAQLWPLLLPNAPRDWHRALDFVGVAHAVDGGFDYNDDRDGLWTEGTAQAALVFGWIGNHPASAKALAVANALLATSGYAYATRANRITTGLAIGPDSTGADFHYYRWPHLGATAWICLAETGWNPLTGKAIKP